MHYTLYINRRDALGVKIPISEARKQLSELLKAPQNSE